MESKKNQNCIEASKKCIEACETCSTENKGKAGMEQSVKLCLASAEACKALIAASKTNSNLETYYKKCVDACTASSTECAKHTEMEHCKKCSEACKKCATECKAMLGVVNN